MLRPSQVLVVFCPLWAPYNINPYVCTVGARVASRIFDLSIHIYLYNMADKTLHPWIVMERHEILQSMAHPKCDRINRRVHRSSDKGTLKSETNLLSSTLSHGHLAASRVRYTRGGRSRDPLLNSSSIIQLAPWSIMARITPRPPRTPRSFFPTLMYEDHWGLVRCIAVRSYSYGWFLPVNHQI